MPFAVQLHVPFALAIASHLSFSCPRSDFYSSFSFFIPFSFFFSLRSPSRLAVSSLFASPSVLKRNVMLRLVPLELCLFSGVTKVLLLDGLISFI